MTVHISLQAVAFVVYTLAILGGAFGISYGVFEWRDNDERADANEVARELLGSWDKDVPQGVRADIRREFLAGEGPGFTGSTGETPSEQLSAALSRVANASALPLVAADMALLDTPKQRLDRLNECLEYLMGTHDAAIACNVQSIAE